MLQGFDQTWGARNIGGTISTSSGIENGNVGSLFGSMLRAFVVVWGLSLAGGVRVVLGSMGPVGCPW
jgi:hypothetical protein